MNTTTANESMKAGSGSIKSLVQTIHELSKEYPENLVPSGDPDDQAILYLISSPQKGFKGLYVDSYGAYHDELSQEMVHKLGSHSNLKLP